jgi:hypothetical protein
MARKSVSLNDNQRATRAELEASNRELRASLKRCEDLVAECKDKIMEAYGLEPPPAAEPEAITCHHSVHNGIDARLG